MTIVIVDNSVRDCPVDKLYAVLAEDGKGNQGIVSSKINNEYMALVFSDEKMMDDISILCGQIQKTQQSTNMKIKMFEFTNKKLVKEY